MICETLFIQQETNKMQLKMAYKLTKLRILKNGFVDNYAPQQPEFFKMLIDEDQNKKGSRSPPLMKVMSKNVQTEIFPNPFLTLILM